MKMIAVTVAATAMLLVVMVVFLIANPFNWFTHQSERFSREKFESVHTGMTKQELIKLLGEPLRIMAPAIPDPECERCMTYYFMGDAPSWLPGFQEAWVYVDGNGIVRDKTWNVEP
jgi:hypothetical protein